MHQIKLITPHVVDRDRILKKKGTRCYYGGFSGCPTKKLRRTKEKKSNITYHNYYNHTVKVQHHSIIRLPKNREIVYSRDSGIIVSLIILRCVFFSGLVVYPVGLILLLLLCLCPLQQQQQFLVLVEAMAASSSTTSSSSSMPVPKLVAFDLE